MGAIPQHWDRLRQGRLVPGHVRHTMNTCSDQLCDSWKESSKKHTSSLPERIAIQGVHINIEPQGKIEQVLLVNMNLFLWLCPVIAFQSERKFSILTRLSWNACDGIGKVDWGGHCSRWRGRFVWVFDWIFKRYWIGEKWNGRES